MSAVDDWEEIDEIDGHLRELEPGFARGFARGLVRGKLAIIDIVFRRYFGDVPDDIRDRLNAMNSDRLQSLGEVLLDLSSYAEVRAWLDANTQ